jgi:hypothetical protein
VSRLQTTERRDGDVIWDVAADGTGGIPTMLAETPIPGSRGQSAVQIEETYEPAINTERPRPRSTPWSWQNAGGGAGFSWQTAHSDQVGGYEAGFYLWSRIDGVIMPSGKVTEVAIPSQVATYQGRAYGAFEHSGDLFFTTGTPYMLRLSGGTGAPVIDAGFTPTLLAGANVTTRATAVFGGKAYVACDGTAPLQCFDGSGWSQGENATARSRLAVVNWLLANGQTASGGLSGSAGSSFEILVTTTADGRYETHVATDPKVQANYSGSLPVADSVAPVQQIVSSPHTVWFATPFGVKGMDGSGAVGNMTPWFRQYYSPSSGGAVAHWANRIWVAHEQGLVMVEPSGAYQDKPQFVQFGYAQANATDIFGRPRWLCPAGDVMFVAYFNGVDSHVLALELRGNQIVWHGPEATYGGQEVTFMYVTNPTGLVPRRWDATISPGGGNYGTDHLYYQQLPKTGNPYVDYLHGTGFEPAAAFEIALPRVDLGTTDLKLVEEIAADADNVGVGGNRLTFNIAQDGGALVQQGRMTSGTRWSISPPPEAAAKSTRFQVQIVGEGNGTAPIVLRSAEIRLGIEPKMRPVRVYALNVDCQTIGPDHDPKSVIRAVLNVQNKGRIRIINHLGIRETVKAEQVGKTIYRKHGDHYDATILMQVTVYSQGWIWGDGTVYGTGAVFGAA